MNTTTTAYKGYLINISKERTGMFNIGIFEKGKIVYDRVRYCNDEIGALVHAMDHIDVWLVNRTPKHFHTVNVSGKQIPTRYTMHILQNRDIALAFEYF